MEISEAWNTLELRASDKLASWDPLYKRQIDLIVRCFGKGRVIANLFAGWGNLAKKLVENGNFVYGIDISRDGVKYMGQKVGDSSSFRPIVSDAYNLPFQNECFDGLTFSLQMPRMEAFTKEAARVLKKRGTLAFTVQYPDQTHRQALSTLQDIERIAASFTPEEIEAMDRGSLRKSSVVRYPSQIEEELQNQGMKVEFSKSVCDDFFHLFVARKAA